MTENTREPVLFWGRRRSEWQAFSNFDPAPIVIDGKEYPTVEHFFQASKAATEWEHQMVRTAATAKEAKKLGRTIQLRPDWEATKMEVMRTGLLAKFRQHAHLRQLLLSTGDRPIHEDSPDDSEWGWMAGTGRDLLGKLLIEVRAILRQEDRDIAEVKPILTVEG